MKSSAGDAEFRTKVDAWVAVLVLAPVGAMPLAVPFIAPNDLCTALVLLASTAGYGLVLWALAWPTRYVLADRRLVVRSGLLRFTLAYDRILAVRRSRNPRSAPAWSLDRIRIDRSPRGMMLVSPEDQIGFLAELAQRAGLEARGDAWVRPEPTQATENRRDSSGT